MRKLFLTGLLVAALVPHSFAQKGKTQPAAAPAGIDTVLLNGAKYRHIGPFRGGRSAAVTGISSKTNTFYFGATGGGVWKTVDGGSSWSSISDGFFGGSIGAVAISEADPNVLYVGGGEKTVRGNVSSGYGMWKSVDGGKSWKNIGLNDSRHITRIRIHPKNPDVLWVGALGHLFGPNTERGVYKSADGGETWKRTLFVNENVGAVDLVLDPSNPRNLYATMWNVRRKPWTLESGGPGSSLWKSTDGGETWTDISTAKGLPKGVWGIAGITVSPANPDRLWAIIENANGGVFRSDDGGKSWNLINSDRNLRQRAWYYSRLYAHPKDEDIVFVLNVGFWKSKDGGKTYSEIETPHSDHHDLWINPETPDIMIVGDDGGAQVTYDGGKNWSTYMNQPTAQFYRVTTDNHFPYRIYVAQQDNSTLRIASRTTGWEGIGERDWEESAGGESGWLAPDPKNNDIVYGGSYGGYLTRLNHATGEERTVTVWPEQHMGWAAKDLKLRFQWNFPILFSRHDPNVLYAAGNKLFRTTNEGQSWEMLGEGKDLTRNDTTKMGSSGGPITKDNTSVEYYGTLFALAESVHEAGVIWTGSDDGIIHLSRDNGKTFENVTPPVSLLPEFAQINSIEAHPFEKGGLYVAATRYKWDDYKPYLLKTTDFGKTWTKITTGINDLHFTRVVRADPDKKGLLFAGTEAGMYVSFNDGANWQEFRRNMPVVPITDLAIKNNDLIVATQGRSIWIMDDLTFIHQLDNAQTKAVLKLYQPRPSIRIFGGRGGGKTGENPANGVTLSWYQAAKPDTATTAKLEIYQPDGKRVVRYSTSATPEQLRKQRDLRKFELKQGMNSANWDLRYPGAQGFERLILWGGGLNGPLALPGNYKAKLWVGKDSSETQFEVKADPRTNATPDDLKAQFEFLMEVRDKLTETNLTIQTIREVRSQINAWKPKLKGDAAKPALEQANAVLKEMESIEKALYQTQNQSGQDPLNFPVRLNNKLSGLVGVVGRGSFRPTDQAVATKNEVVAAIEKELARFKVLKDEKIPALSKAIIEAGIPAITVE
jgi:photosystem II stability/assembly factor-like uncharacterized protein